MRQIRYGSVCSGVEAASLAWMTLGWEPVFYAEVEPFPCAVLQQRFGATKPLRPLDPDETEDPKERAMRKRWLAAISKLPETGTIPNLGDFTKIRGTDYDGEIDVLVGGTPCQDLSVAGKRAGFDGKRSSLAIDFVRLAYESNCKYIVWENVPGAFSSHHGRDFATLLSLFTGCEIGVPRHGFDTAGFICPARGDRFGVAWRVLDAQFTRVSGFPFAVPQRRRRLFVVGCLGDWASAAQILLEPGRLSWNTPARIRAREETAGGPGPCAEVTGGGRFWNGADVAESLTTTSNEKRMPDKDRFQAVIEDVAGTLKGRSGSSPFPERGQTVVCETWKGYYSAQEYAGTLEQNEEQHRRNLICFHGSQDPICNSDHANAVNRNNGLENCVCQYGDMSGSLTAKHDSFPCADKGMNVVCYDNQTYARNPRETGEICCTLRGNMGTGGNTVPLIQDAVSISANIIGRKNKNGGHQLGIGGDVSFTHDTSGVMGVSYRNAVRRLTPLECERLMGFPDGHTRIVWNGKPESQCPDAPRYKACGNSMCVNVMRWIGEQIQRVETINQLGEYE